MTDEAVILYHGGAPGFGVGESVVPHDTKRLDGCSICEAGGDGNHLPDRVFASALRLYAKYYASKWGRGWLYIVEPEGAMTRSEVDPFGTYHAASFRVIKICERGVELTMSERRHLYRLWKRDDLTRGRGTGAEAADRYMEKLLRIRR
jgi:hypothetical protein